MLLNYTSGTTGFSKGVMLTGNNLAGNVTFGIRTELLKKGDKVLSFLPLAHAYGCAFDFLTATAVGTHVTLLGKVPSPKDPDEGLRRGKAQPDYNRPPRYRERYTRTSSSLSSTKSP